MFPVGCLFCEQDNPVGSRFCNECGKALRHKPCGTCGAVAERGAARCGHCGQAFAQTPALEVETVAWSELESDLAEIESGLATKRFGAGPIERSPDASASVRSAGPISPEPRLGIQAAVPSDSHALRIEPRLLVESSMSFGPRSSAVGVAPVEPQPPAIAPVTIESPAPTSGRRRGLSRSGFVAALMAAIGLSTYFFLRGVPGQKEATTTITTAAPTPAMSAAPVTPTGYETPNTPSTPVVSALPVRDATRQPPEARACTEAVATLGLCQPSSTAEANR